MEFKEAARKDIKIKMDLKGLSGSGKSKSSLYIAKGLAGGDMTKVAIAQTEAGRAQCYLDEFSGFKVLELPPPFTPGKFIEAIDLAEKSGFRILIIDSLSDEWAGEGGALDMHTAASEVTKNSFTAWKKITPQHEALFNKILSSQLHIICTFKKKSEYVMEEIERNGRKITQPKKVGTTSIAREGSEYRFMLEFDLDLQTHMAIATKDNIGIFDGKPPFLITEATGLAIREWCIGK